MELIENRVFENETFDIDDKQFRNCTLVGCVLRYSGRPVIFETSQLRRCNYVFYGPARGTVHFLQMTGLLTTSPTEWGELPDEVH